MGDIMTGPLQSDATEQRKDSAPARASSSPYVSIDDMKISRFQKWRLTREGSPLDNWKHGEWGYIVTSG